MYNMKNIVRIKLNNQCASKLKFVKYIKELLDLGLKDSKDIVDNICSIPFKPVELEIPIDKNISDIKKLLDDLSWTSYGEELSFYDYEINGGIQWQREIKMLQLGLGEKQDYLDFIKQHIETNFGNSEELLKFILDKLTTEELQETLNKISYDSNM